MLVWDCIYRLETLLRYRNRWHCWVGGEATTTTTTKENKSKEYIALTICGSLSNTRDLDAVVYMLSVLVIPQMNLVVLKCFIRAWDV